MHYPRRSRIGVGGSGLVLVFISCGGGTSFSPPPINLSVSVNNTTVVVPANSTAVNIPVTIVAPTETATFTITGLPAGVSGKLQGIGIESVRVIDSNGQLFDGTRHLYAYDYRWLVAPNRISGVRGSRWWRRRVPPRSRCPTATPRCIAAVHKGSLHCGVRNPGLCSRR
jgi:hypothetical protein